MRRLAGLLGVVVTLALGTGCFEVKLEVALQPDGSVGVLESMWLTQGVVDLLWKMGHDDPAAGARFKTVHDEMVTRYTNPSGEALEALHALGVRSVQRRAGASRDEWGMEQSAVYDSVTAMTSGWPAVHGEGGVPGDMLDLTIHCDAERVCTLDYAQRGDEDSPSLVEGPFEELNEAMNPDPEASGHRPSKREEKAAMVRAARMVNVMSAEAANIKIQARLTLPGEILEPLPDGCTVEGSTLTWTVDGGALMGQVMSGLQGAPPEPTMLPAGQVRFKLAGGTRIPESWLVSP